MPPVPALPEIRLYTAHPGSGLRRLVEPHQSADDDAVEPSDDAPEPQPPYWAYAWAGGAVLARYILDHPQSVAGRRVLDLGAGSGLVGIAAAKAGASAVIAAEIDRNGVAAIGLNAAANGVAITIVDKDITTGPPPAVDLVLAGDVFYGRRLLCGLCHSSIAAWQPASRCWSAIPAAPICRCRGCGCWPNIRCRISATRRALRLKPSGVFSFEQR